MDAVGWAFVASVAVFVGWVRFRLYGFDAPARRPTRRDVVTVLGVAALLFATFGAVEAVLIDR